MKISKLYKTKKTFTMKWGKFSSASKKKIDGIEIQYSKRKDFKKNTVTKRVKKTATSYKASKLGRKTRYYVRMRTYKGKQKSAWSPVKAVKTK